jgi:hypothetical protein
MSKDSRGGNETRRGAAMFDGQRSIATRRPTLDFGLWTLDFGLWTLDFGLWTLD